MAESFIEECGGPRKFAKLLWQEYKSAPKGGLVRARTMDMILRCWKYASEKTSGREAGTLSDEDLERELNAILREPSDAKATQTDTTSGA